MKSTNENIIKHYKEFFDGHDFEIPSWELGPINEVVPDFQGEYGRSQGPSATHEIECCHENLYAFVH
jgi:hypothetical protein